jgi:hypothetical protein
MGKTAKGESTEIQPVLKYNNQIAEATAHALNGGAHGLKALPGLIKITIEKETWRVRYDSKRDTKFECASFAEYIASKPPKGLGADIETLRHLCEVDPEARDMVDKEIQQDDGPPEGAKNALKSYSSGYKAVTDEITVDIINSYSTRKANEINGRPDGTSVEAALRRLRKDRPDLHVQVIEKKLSPHSAMVEAGFRPKTITVPVDVKKAARVLVRNFQDDAVKLVHAIQEILLDNEMHS